MSRTQARLSALESLFRPLKAAVSSDDDRRWYLALCTSSLHAAILQFAGDFAERRYHHTNGARWVHTGDWTQGTTEVERASAVQQEVNRLIAMDVHDTDAALSHWMAFADQEGWPALNGLTYRMDLDGFTALLTRRASIDVARGTDMPAAVQWRREHPDWRPGMSGDEAERFEIGLADEATRLYAQWFEEQAA